MTYKFRFDGQIFMAGSCPFGHSDEEFKNGLPSIQKVKGSKNLKECVEKMAANKIIEGIGC